MIDIGGYRLQIRCEGQGSPTVVFENGALPLLDIFEAFRALVAQERRACSYDRAGTGKSEAGPEPRDAQRIAAELHALLESSGERGPLVFVSWSAGAMYTMEYAQRYPDDVAGIVFVDPRTPAYHLAVGATFLQDPENVRLLDMLPPTYRMEFMSWDADAAAWAARGALPDVPVVVLSAGASEAAAALAPPDDYPLWVRTHADLAASLPRGTHIVVNDAEHRVWERNPEAVLNAIRSVANAQ
jgi:pimeloyl-ACP methyl ester carboxylesterase